MPVKRCDCRADARGNTAGAQYQDKEYGSGMRLWTTAGTKTKNYTSRCTVCSKSQSVKEQIEDTKPNKEKAGNKAKPEEKDSAQATQDRPKSRGR